MIRKSDLIDMKIINKTAIAIIPKQPYIDWANNFEDGVGYEMLMQRRFLHGNKAL